MLLGVLAGCAQEPADTGRSAPSTSAEASTRSDSSAPATKGDPGPQRRDLAPLTKRFAALGTPVSATWYGGTFGDSDAPGPASYWIDAVVTLTPATTNSLAALAADANTAGSSETPSVVDGLESAQPDGPLVTSAALNEEFSSPGWSTRVWLDADSDTLVLQAQGQG